MKKFILAFCTLIPFIASAQFGVSFHQSNIPFVGFNYQITSKLRPELRFGVDEYLESLSVEAVLMYDLLKKDEFEFYAGLGLRGNDFAGVVIPVGLNIYPLPTKQFGFHIELAPVISDDVNVILRGSWGIRYRFRERSGRK